MAWRQTGDKLLPVPWLTRPIHWHIYVALGGDELTIQSWWRIQKLTSVLTMPVDILVPNGVNTLRPRQNGCHFADNTFNHIFVNENVRISIKFSLKFVPKGPINNIPALVQIMAWRRPGDKPLSEPVMASRLMHICVTRPQWVKPSTSYADSKVVSSGVTLFINDLDLHFCDQINVK